MFNKNIYAALSRKNFEILAALASGKHLSQNLNELEALGLVEDRKITNHGISALEPYRAKRAIFIAAGFGSRLVPITLNTPKPLIRVHGKRIIDGLIDSCLAAGIEEIYIVRGYLAEQFDQLLYKYPMIKFLENPAYDEANNISSSMAARFMLSNSYVLESDLLIHNPEIITPYHYTFDFLAIKKSRTDDWCFTVNQDGIIIDEKIGGFDRKLSIAIHLLQP